MRPLRRVVLGLALLGGLLSGCATAPEPRGADHHSTAPRSLVLHHPESGEGASVTYWNGRGYDPAAMEAINALFRDRRTGEIMPIDPALMDYIADLLGELGLPPDTPVHLTSCYRSPLTNASLARTNGNVAENSFHMRGQAADLQIPGVPLARIAEAAARLQRGGYALYAAHVHVDTGPVRTWTPRGGAGGWLEARARASRTGPARAVVAQTKPPKGTPAKVQVAQSKEAEKPATKPKAAAATKPPKTPPAKTPPAKTPLAKSPPAKTPPAKTAAVRTKTVTTQLAERDSRAVGTAK